MEYNGADHLVELQLAGASIASVAIQGLAYGIMLGMETAVQTVCGQAYSAKQYIMLRVICHRSMIIMTGTAILLGILYYFADPVLIAIGQSKEISAAGGCICVSSYTKMLLNKEFDLLSRELKVVSVIPEHSYAGSIPKNVVFGIFDDEGNLDSKMDGFQHTLTVDLYTLSSVQYKFSHGKCTVPKIMLPEDMRLLQFKAFHSWHTELFVHIKVDILPNPRLEIVSVPDQTFDDAAICHACDESTAIQSQISNQTMVKEVRLYIGTFMSEMTKWEKDLKQLGTKVKKREDELRKLETNLSEVNSSLSDLERELNKRTFSSKSDGKANSNPYSHNVE